MKWLAPVVLSVLIIGFANLKFFQIKKVVCQLNNYPCSLDLEPFLVQLSGKNIFKLKQQTVSNDLQNIDPMVTDIKIIKKLPNQLIINLSYRQPLAQITVFTNLEFIGLDSTASATLSGEMSARSWLMDKAGELYDLNNHQSALTVIVAVPEKFDPGQIFQLLTALQNYYVSFNLLAWIDQFTMIVKTKAGSYAIIDPTKNMDLSVAALQYVLAGLKIGDRLPIKIDLRFDKPVLTY